MLPDEARKGEITKLLDRLEAVMVTVGTKAPIFSELFSPVLSWPVCQVFTCERDLGLQLDVLCKRRDEQLANPV